MRKSQIILTLMALALLTGCKGQSVLVGSTDSTRIVREYQRDTIYEQVFHMEQWRHDTLYITDTKCQYVERIVSKTDTISRTDSIPYAVPTPTRMRNAYDKATARGFWILLAGIILYIGGKIVCKKYGGVFLAVLRAFFRKMV